MRYMRVVIEPSDYYEEWDIPIDNNSDIPDNLNDEELKSYVIENFYSLGAIMHESGYQHGIISDEVELVDY